MSLGVITTAPGTKRVNQGSTNNGSITTQASNNALGQYGTAPLTTPASNKGYGTAGNKGPVGGVFIGVSGIPGTPNGSTTSTGPTATPTNPLITQYGDYIAQQQQALAAQNQGDLAYQSALYDLSKSDAQNSLAAQLASIGAGSAGNAASQKTNALDLANATSQLGYLGDAYNSNIAYNGQQLGTLDSQYAHDKSAVNNQLGTLLSQYQNDQSGINNQLSNIPTQQGFLSRSLSDALSQAGLTRDVAQAASLSDATARGAVPSSGFHQAVASILAQYANSQNQAQLGYDTGTNTLNQNQLGLQNQLAGLGISYQGGKNALDSQLSGLDIGYTSGKQGLEHQKQGLDIGYQSDTGNAQTNIDKLNVQAQALKQVAGSYGVAASKAQAAYKNSITKAGLDYNHTVDQINGMLASGNADLEKQALDFQASMFQAAALAGGYGT